MKELKRYAINENKRFYGLSYNKIASMLNITKKSAIELIELLVNNGSLNKKVSKKELICSKKESSNIAFDYFKSINGGKFVFLTRNGAIYKQESNYYYFNQYSINNITMLHYK